MTARLPSLESLLRTDLELRRRPCGAGELLGSSRQLRAWSSPAGAVAGSKFGLLRFTSKRWRQLLCCQSCPPPKGTKSGCSRASHTRSWFEPLSFFVIRVSFVLVLDLGFRIPPSSPAPPCWGLWLLLARWLACSCVLPCFRSLCGELSASLGRADLLACMPAGPAASFLVRDGAWSKREPIQAKMGPA